MQVFNLFIKIVNKNKGLIIMYFAIFGVILFFMSTSNQTQNQVEREKVNCYLEVEDNTKKSTKDFLDYLSPYIEIVDIKTNVDDALFWDDIDLYLSIPSNFLEDILDGKTDVITMKSSADSIQAYSLITTINSYFNSVKENIRLNLCSMDDALVYTKNALFESENKLNVSLVSKVNESMQAYIYTTSTYVISSLVLFIIGIVSFEMRTTDITRRLNISPLTIKKRSFLLIISYAVCAILFVLFVVGLNLIFLGKDGLNNLFYYILTSLIFSFVMVLMALFLSSLFESSVAFNCVTVILPLVAGFLTGSFVPIEFMSDSTLLIGHLFPNYYVNSAFMYLNNMTSFNLGEYLSYLWPLIIFIVVFILGTIIIQKKMSTREN